MTVREILWQYFTSPLTAARCIEQFVVGTTIAMFVYAFTRLGVTYLTRKK